MIGFVGMNKEWWSVGVGESCGNFVVDMVRFIYFYNDNFVVVVKYCFVSLGKIIVNILIKLC